jgi:quinol monooxygenase YgiN
MPIALIAEFTVPTRDLERFISAARQELEAVRAGEPGCLRFDVIVFDEAGGQGAFVEVFADQEAADEHAEFDHFTAFFDAIEDIDVQWTMRRGVAIG